MTIVVKCVGSVRAVSLETKDYRKRAIRHVRSSGAENTYTLWFSQLFSDFRRCSLQESIRNLIPRSCHGDHAGWHCCKTLLFSRRIPARPNCRKVNVICVAYSFEKIEGKAESGSFRPWVVSSGRFALGRFALVLGVGRFALIKRNAVPTVPGGLLSRRH